MKEDTIICRCEDVTLGEIEALLQEGYQTVDEIKKLTRCGMGPCQGSTCRSLLIDLIARYWGIEPGEITISTYRPPIHPVRIGTIVASKE